MNNSDSTPGRCPFSHATPQHPGANSDALSDIAAIRDSHAKYAGIIESAMDAIITVDDQQAIVLFNKAAETMFRCTKQQALGKPLATFIPQRYREVHHNHVQNFDHSQVADRAMGRQRPLAALRADGEEFPIEASISQAEVQGRKHFTAIIRDISQRLRTERLVSEMEARYRTIFEYAGVGILMIDSQGVIIDANPAVERLLSVSNSQLRSRSYCDLVHPRDVNAVKAETLLAETQNKRSVIVEIRFITKEKRRVWARVVHTAVQNTLSSRVNIVAIIEDITEKKHAQRRLKRLRARHELAMSRIMQLTERESEVLWLMVDGDPTKIMAAKLGISHKTIDVHRGRIMKKMSAGSLPQLVQMVMPIRKYCNHLITS